MESYLDIFLLSEGTSLREVITALKKIELQPISGPHDFLIKWNTEKQILETMDKVRNTLKGMNVIYRLETVIGKKPEYTEWPPVGHPKE